MNAELSTPPQQDLAVEVLAKELHVPTNEVARLYGIELAKLKIGARITGYLPIFAIRNVRILLRHLKTKRPISA
jgi:hypothetical protein